MRTLIVETNPLRAQSYVAQFGGTASRCDLARTPAQARLMVMSIRYDRVCFCMDAVDGSSHALLAVIRAVNPDCEVIDIVGRVRRRATGPLPAIHGVSPPTAPP